MRLSQIKNKNQARQYAIDWQVWVSKKKLSYGEMAAYQDGLRALGKKWGLLREFKENGIV
jgi:hypothetical protein